MSDKPKSNQTKLPAYVWYPGDWQKDTAVQCLNYFDKGVWREMMDYMHESEVRGKLIANGKALSLEHMARLLRLDESTLTTTITNLLDLGVAVRCPETGAIMSKRMVRDELTRQEKRLNGFLGGNPALVKPKLNQLVNHQSYSQDKQKQGSSFTSTSSVSSSKQLVKCADAGEKENGAPAPQKPNNHARMGDLLRRSMLIMGKENMRANGGYFTILAKQNPDKYERVLNDLEDRLKRDPPLENPGGYFTDTWKRFV